MGQMSQKEVDDWAEFGMEASAAIRKMTTALRNREWAEHVSANPTIAALEAEITELVGRVNAGVPLMDHHTKEPKA